MEHLEKAAVFILLGQSNAVGHGLPMREEDVIHKPLQNVFGLHRDENQSFHNAALKWSGYTSGGMNLAEEQDDTYSVPNCLAALWQQHIDEGNACGLPDLYIVQIAIGAEGVTDGYMWYPDREPKLVPGRLGTVDISLFPFCNHIFALLDDSFSKMQKEYEIIGLHWRGGENDVTAASEYLTENLQTIYRRMFDEWNRLLGCPPIVLHKMCCSDRMMEMDPSGGYLANMTIVNEVFLALATDYGNVCAFDPTTLPQYIPDVRGNGLFEDDMVHFTEAVNQKVAEDILAKYR